MHVSEAAKKILPGGIMAGCNVEYCRELTSGTTFLCDQHWAILRRRQPDLEKQYRNARERFRNDPCLFRRKAMEQAEQACLVAVRKVLQREAA
jgi:hypothetical protein